MIIINRSQYPYQRPLSGTVRSLLGLVPGPDKVVEPVVVGGACPLISGGAEVDVWLGIGLISVGAAGGTRAG